MVWAAAARLVAVTTMAAHAQARGERERARCRGRFDHESELAVREASRRISGPNSALLVLVLIILLSSQLILIKVVNTRGVTNMSLRPRSCLGGVRSGVGKGPVREGFSRLFNHLHSMYRN